MTIKNLKQKIATILGIGTLIAGGTTINVNIQTQEFYEQLADGKLKVNMFNQKAYKGVAKSLADEMDIYLDTGEPMTYQALSTYLQVVSREAEKDKGWTLKASDQKEFLTELNENLQTKIK